jgi:AraC-like DNA-binding protein
MLRGYSKKRPIRATLSKADHGAPLHSHDYYEVEIIIEGEAVHHLNAETYDIKKGSAYILSPASFHSYEISDPLKLFCINFDGSAIPEKLFFKMATIGAGKHIDISSARLADIEKLCGLLVSETRKKNGGCSIELCACILAMLLEEVDELKIESDRFDLGMQRALIYLNSHFYESPSLSEVAREANYHPNYFSEMFTAYFGQSFSSKLNDLKTNYAKVLLRAGFSVTETCFRSGFRSMSSFLSVFKEKTGMPPKKYKELTYISD